MENLMATVYIHRRLDIFDSFKNVFYVGITKHDMTKKYLCYRPYGKTRSKEWKNLAIDKLNGKYEVEIVCTLISIEDAYKKEVELINLYGRNDLNKGELVNKSDGGKGVLNKIYTEEELKRKVEVAIECNNREGARERMSKKLKEITSAPERRAQMSKSAIISNNREDVKYKISQASKKNHSDIYFKEKHRLATKIALNKKEVREKLSKSQKIAQNKIETKLKIKKSLEKYLNDEEFIKKRNSSIKDAWLEKNKKNISLGESICKYEKCGKTFNKKRNFQKYCTYQCGTKQSRLKQKYAL
jgi:hypothetical protein